MENAFQNTNQIQKVSSFKELISQNFDTKINAFCWSRKLEGDFGEIVSKLTLKENITEISSEDLQKLQLTAHGKIARTTLLEDMKLLKAHGADPSLNLLKCYEKDDGIFPTDVYSFHVDRSPIPTNTFLCTYYGEPSEMVANTEARQKILNPEIRTELKKLHKGSEDTFEEFLKEYFFDLHYETKPNADIINLGVGNLWRLAVDHPKSKVLPCIHRAPKEKDGKIRLLLIC